MKKELTPAEYAELKGITRNAVYMRMKAGKLDIKYIGLNHWKKREYVILVDS